MSVAQGARLAGTLAPVGVRGGYDAALAFLVLFAAAGAFVDLIRLQLWWPCFLMFVLRFAFAMPAMLGVLRDGRAFLVFPLVCLASVLWSADPGLTLYSGVQLLLTTLIAMFLGARFSVRGLLWLIFTAATVMTLLSALHGATGLFPFPAYGVNGSLKGIFVHKNVLGSCLLLTVLSGTCIALTPGRDIGVAGRAAVVAVVVLALAMLVLSQSIINLLSALIFPALFVALARHRLARGVTVLLLAAGFAVFAVLPVVLAALQVDVVGSFFDATGKDATLTGRTTLWQIAWQSWLDRPLLGSGYAAYWDAGAFATEQFRIEQVSGSAPFSLHNLVADVAVTTGVPGLFAIAVTIVAALGRVLRFWLATRGADAAAALAFAACYVSISVVEPGLSLALDHKQILLIALSVAAQGDLRHLRLRALRRRRSAAARPGPDLSDARAVPGG